MVRTLSFSTALLGLGLLPATVLAAEAYDNCTGFIDSLPATISTQGTWCLRQDLATAQVNGAAITVATNNVIIDCNDFKAGGLAAGEATVAVGVHAVNRLNISVRHCNLRGFQVGVALLGTGGGHMVEDNRLQGNTHTGLHVHGEGSLVRRNTVTDTGGSTSALGFAVGIRTQDGVQVIDNTVTGVQPVADLDGNAHATGLLIADNASGTVQGNRVRQLLPTGAGLAEGIRLEGSLGGLIEGNDLIGPGAVDGIAAAPGAGLQCDSATAVATGNRVLGFAQGVVNCTDAGDNAVETVPTEITPEG